METEGRRGINNFDISLFQCYKARDPGLACVFNHVCCTPCLQLDALTIANVREAVAIVGGGLLGGALARSNNAGVAAVGTVSQALAALAMRREIVRKYEIDETASASFLLSCCCMPCSTVQVVNEVMVRERGNNGGAYRYACIGLFETRKVVVNEVMDRK